MHTHTHTYTYIIHTYTYIHTYAHTFIHTYIPKYTYTHTSYTHTLSLHTLSVPLSHARAKMHVLYSEQADLIKLYLLRQKSCLKWVQGITLVLMVILYATDTIGNNLWPYESISELF
jgi:hypothetical protein